VLDQQQPPLLSISDWSFKSFLLLPQGERLAVKASSYEKAALNLAQLDSNKPLSCSQSSLLEETQMSHFSTLRTKITDAEILKASLRDLGISVKTEADVRGYNGQRVRSDIVAVLEGEYDLGWSRNSDGSFDLIADLWGVAKKHNQTELINSINQKYAVNKTLAEVKQRGLQNANVKLVLQ
jgi:hypothetical protein